MGTKPILAILQCRKIAEEEKIEQRQSYKRTAKKLLIAQRFRNHPLNKKKATQAEKKLKTIAGRLLRELERKLTAEIKQKYEAKLKIFNKEKSTR